MEGGGASPSVEPGITAEIIRVLNFFEKSAIFRFTKCQLLSTYLLLLRERQ